MDYISKLPEELYTLFIMVTDQSTRWRVYAGMIGISQFARTLTPGRILDWMEICGITARVVPHQYLFSDKYIECAHIEWKLNGDVHRFGGPAKVFSNGLQVYYQFNRIYNDGFAEIIGVDGKVYWTDLIRGRVFIFIHNMSLLRLR